MSESTPVVPEQKTGNHKNFLLEVLKALPSTYVLVFLLAAVPVYLFLVANPPQVIAASVVAVLGLLAGLAIHYLDKERRRAEGAATELRRLLEMILPKGGEQRDVWSRPMLQWPFSASIIERVCEVFDRAIVGAQKELGRFHPGADALKIRANLFLPTSEAVNTGDVCNLIIPRFGDDDDDPKCYLQRNMASARECHLRFRPNEGATGRVFVESRAIGVLSHPAWLAEEDKSKQREIERWVYVHLDPEADLSKPGASIFTDKGKTAFHMSDFQNRRVADDLAWIISMPIFSTITEHREVVGVFNVDCREYELKPDQLRTVFVSLMTFAEEIAEVLNPLPKDRIAILRFR